MNNKKRLTALQTPDDRIEELARAIYIRMCGDIYSAPESKKPDPKAVARLSLTLGEIFIAANLEAKAAREAKEAAPDNVGYLDIDFASIGAARDINAASRFGDRDTRSRAVHLARAA
jgi:hypothetical protein